jgi:hypothetical protein
MLNINNIAYQLPIEVDSTKLLNELDNLVLPHFNKDVKDINALVNSKGANISITSLETTPLDKWYTSGYNRPMTRMKDTTNGEELTKHYQKFTLGFPGQWRDNLEAMYDDGTGDRDFVHWHPSLIDSEIYNLKNRIADFFKINNRLRCRASFLPGYTKMGFHADPHTPWRVHINLQSGPGTRWIFRTLDPKETVEWVQPKDSVWLIRTGDVQHSVEVAEGEVRWQLFYHIWQSNLGPNYHQIA